MILKQTLEFFPFSFSDPHIARDMKFIVVGAGGTGGYLIRDLARLIGTFNLQNNMDMSIIVIDGDKVEPKNLIRQNFIKSDLGKYKAEVMAARSPLFPQAA